MTTKKPKRKPVSFLLAQQKEVGAAEFKARCLEIMDEVERTGAQITITKHRKPVARLVPYGVAEPFCGSLRGMVVAQHDLVSPIAVHWNADDADSS